MSFIQENKANVVNFQLLVNLDKKYMGIHYTILATFLQV